MSNETKPSAPQAGSIEPARALTLNDLIAVGAGAVVSRTLAKGAGGTVTLFAFDAGEGLSEHSAPFDAYVQVLDGALDLRIGGEPVHAEAGQIVLMPANVPHGLTAQVACKMMLVMLREPKGS